VTERAGYATNFPILKTHFYKFLFIELFNRWLIARRNEYKMPALLFWQATERVIFLVVK
jgi:hypothetical protein